jgi:hypothetical protein
MRLIRSDTLDQLGLRQIHPVCKRKLETFFASSRIYLSKGAVGHLLMKLAYVSQHPFLATAFFAATNARIQTKGPLNADF